jgi:hypothetical protein
MGNKDYQENAWFEEQPGKTWGALFLEKSNEASSSRKEFLICNRPQNRLKVRMAIGLRRIKNKFCKLRLIKK